MPESREPPGVLPVVPGAGNLGKPVALIDLARQGPDRLPPTAASLYAVEQVRTVPMTFPDEVWPDTFAAFSSPREIVEDQDLVLVRDLHLGTEAIFNGLRARRVLGDGGGKGPPAEPGRGNAACRWCDPGGWGRGGLWADVFSEVTSPDGRVIARANWARQAEASGVVFGDAAMHDLLALPRSAFVALFDTAEQYLRRAAAARPGLDCFLVFLNGGPKSGASVEHAHLQVVGRGSRHFAYPEAIAARCPPDYWVRARVAHEELGLAVAAGPCAAWASLVPVKDRDVTAVSENLHDGAGFVYEVLRRLIDHGTHNFSVAAILSPAYLKPGAGGRFAGWPAVLWRIVDRGLPTARNNDMGCMELFGSSVVATDPFLVAEWLRRSPAASGP
jgi:hypothetical protein